MATAKCVAWKYGSRRLLLNAGSISLVLHQVFAGMVYVFDTTTFLRKLANRTS